MNLKDILAYPVDLFNSLFPPPSYTTEERRREIARKVVFRQMLQDRGDCDCCTSSYESRTRRLLLQGRYITAKDAERIRQEAIRNII